MVALRRLLAIAGPVVGLAFVGLDRGPPDRAPRIPTDDAEVLVLLPGGPDDPEGRVLDRLRRALASSPRQLDLALRTARLAVELGRRRADPRFLGLAEAALAPWATEEAPAGVLVLRATIAQSLHAFEAALRLLDGALLLDPTDAQAWLTRGTILTVVGRYDEARESCRRLPMEALARVVCETSVDGLTGHARSASERLERALAERRVESTAERAWAVTALAELAARVGDVERAERLLREVLALDAGDTYARAALADLLLDAGRRDEVRSLVGEREDDAMLLRRALAEGPTSPAAARLDARFSAARASGDVVHRREEARLRLLRGEGALALELAQANWEVQKEPIDARVLLEAARATGDDARSVLEHVERTGLEDPVIARRARELGR